MRAPTYRKFMQFAWPCYSNTRFRPYSSRPLSQKKKKHAHSNDILRSSLQFLRLCLLAVCACVCVRVSFRTLYVLFVCIYFFILSSCPSMYVYTTESKFSPCSYLFHSTHRSRFLPPLAHIVLPFFSCSSFFMQLPCTLNTIEQKGGERLFWSSPSTLTFPFHRGNAAHIYSSFWSIPVQPMHTQHTLSEISTF